MIDPSSLAKVAAIANRPLVQQCESLMTDARAMMKTLGLTDVQRALILGKLDARCIWHVLKLGKIGEGRDFGDIAGIAQVLDVLIYLGKHACTWVALRCDAAACIVFDTQVTH